MRIIILSLLVMFSISACNTLEGLGTDIKRTGEGIEDIAR